MGVLGLHPPPPIHLYSSCPLLNDEGNWWVMSVKILVAIHNEKSSIDRIQDNLYIPIQVGKVSGPVFKVKCQGDDTGENISSKNKNYCELTGLYWGWKNLSYDYLGICHYRRFFSTKFFGNKWDRILTEKQAEKILENTNVILPAKRNYIIETNYTQYIHAHHKADLDTTRQILSEKYPEYIAAFDNYMSKTEGHHFNMFVMRKDILDGYCTWLFDVLFELEKRLDISTYDDYNKRVFGFVSERLIDTWLDTNKISYAEVPTLFMEKQDWIKKGYNFLARKFRAKYE